MTCQFHGTPRVGVTRRWTGFDEKGAAKGELRRSGKRSEHITKAPPTCLAVPGRSVKPSNLLATGCEWPYSRDNAFLSLRAPIRKGNLSSRPADFIRMTNGHSRRFLRLGRGDHRACFRNLRVSADSHDLSVLSIHRGHDHEQDHFGFDVLALPCVRGDLEPQSSHRGAAASRSLVVVAAQRDRKAHTPQRIHASVRF